MANILLNDAEYQEIKAAHDDALAKAKSHQSPRMSAHYQMLAKHHAGLLDKEEARRALKQNREATRTALEQLRQERRAAALTVAQQKLAGKGQRAGQQANPSASGRK